LHVAENARFLALLGMTISGFLALRHSLRGERTLSSYIV
jgi:hypothetical protein